MADMNSSQKLPVTIGIVRPDGATAEVEAGSVVWASSDETVVRAEMGEDGLTGFVVAVAPSENRPARLSVSADADLGSGVMTITGLSEPINVLQDPATQASTFTITFGAAVPKAEAATGA